MFVVEHNHNNFFVWIDEIEEPMLLNDGKKDVWKAEMVNKIENLLKNNGGMMFGKKE
jgi:hypothetical protein